MLHVFDACLGIVVVLLVSSPLLLANFIGCRYGMQCPTCFRISRRCYENNFHCDHCQKWFGPSCPPYRTSRFE